MQANHYIASLLSFSISPVFAPRASLCIHQIHTHLVDQDTYYSQIFNLEKAITFKFVEHLSSHNSGSRQNQAVTMLPARAMKPKLSINIAPVSSPAAASTRPALSLKSPVTPMAPMRSPLSPLPSSPTSYNTMLNKRGFTTFVQQPTYSYTNASSARSILKKSSTVVTRVRQLQFEECPVVHQVSPIEEPDYYGGYKKMTKDERRWMVKA